MNNKAYADTRANVILDNAKTAGAEMVITACPLCMYNLQQQNTLPVAYFTELMAEALGLKEAEA